MSERGFFVVDRGIWGHPSFKNEPFTEREAWIWIVGFAAWREKKVRVGRTTLNLKRGQLAFATRFLATKWTWSHSRVVRFLKRLKTETMVTLETTRDATLITVCKYDEYQFGENAAETQNETRSETLTTRSRNKEEENNKSTTNSEAKASAPAGTPVYRHSRQELWGEGVPILISLGVAEKQARSMIGYWLKLMKDDAQAVLGAIQRARDHCVHNPIPWITNALKVPHEQSTRQHRTNSAAGPASSHSTAIIAGVASAADRRARERSTAGQQRHVSQNADTSGKPDPEFFGEAGGPPAH